MTGPDSDLRWELTELLEERAEELETSIPPIPRLLAVGAAARRQRRTRAWVAGGAAAAVVAVVAVPTLLVHGDNPSPRPPVASRTAEAVRLRIGPPTLPYLAGRELHLDGRTLTLDARPSAFISSGDTTIYRDATGGRWWRVWPDGGITQFGPTYDAAQPWQSIWIPRISADGRIVAELTHPTRSTSRITVYDAAGQDEIGHVDLDVPFRQASHGGDSVRITGVNADGRVYWTQTGKTPTWWMWDPGSSPIRLHTDLGPDGDAYPPDGALTSSGEAVTIADDGTAQPITAIPAAGVDMSTVLWSPSGAVLATETTGGQHVLVHRDGSGGLSPAPPGIGVQQWLGFESDAYVIAAVNVDGAPELARCATDHPTCVVIGTLPAGWQTWSWATSPPSLETMTAPALPSAAPG